MISKLIYIIKCLFLNIIVDKLLKHTSQVTNFEWSSLKVRKRKCALLKAIERRTSKEEARLIRKAMSKLEKRLAPKLEKESTKFGML